MLSNFKSEELVKVQGKLFPVVGGRLRLAHEDNSSLSIETKVISYDGEIAVIQATVKTEKGVYNGLGNASTKRDRILSNAILELAETRAIARALRFAGYGVEYTGFEEVENNSENDDKETASKTQLMDIFAYAKEINMSNEDLKSIIVKTTGKTYTKELTKKEANTILEMLTKIKENEQDNLIM
ncbi:hypothetical protein [Lutispora thermophila]|uniref:ERF superfamily protein n=1 Tax=Lutispora thermophila DSM 19022 TaxID=1122184 RepID=A0A1M6F8K8_9FIRM|nr:hypothetical protein [Lutispora thermophila]SHI94002.1 hypothetical protein SAMN02745176_01876 [Lutispora thermophila DSM 19022]